MGRASARWAKITPRRRTNVRFVDSHLHLNDYADAAGIIRAARETDTKLLACSTDEPGSNKTIRLARENPGMVSAFAGVHPSETKTAAGVEWLADMLVHAAGVGEIGLDPKYSDAGAGSQQRRLFLAQLAAAEKAGKPVQVHSRNAEAACIDELSTHRLTSVLLHWFNGESELGRAEEKGYFVSFGPALLESRKLQRMAIKYSRDLILVESDGPVAFPSLGGAEGPLTTPSVVFKLAELRGLKFEEMAETTARNASSYLPALGKVKPTTDSGLDSKIGQD
jgi:TatD DNase family protein